MYTIINNRQLSNIHPKFSVYLKYTLFFILISNLHPLKSEAIPSLISCIFTCIYMHIRALFSHTLKFEVIPTYFTTQFLKLFTAVFACLAPTFLKLFALVFTFCTYFLKLFATFTIVQVNGEFDSMDSA